MTERVRVQGIEVAYEDLGAGPGPPFVLVHGFTMRRGIVLGMGVGFALATKERPHSEDPSTVIGAAGVEGACPASR